MKTQKISYQKDLQVQTFLLLGDLARDITDVMKFLQKICFKEQIASKSKDDFLKNSKNDRHL